MTSYRADLDRRRNGGAGMRERSVLVAALMAALAACSSPAPQPSPSPPVPLTSSPAVDRPISLGSWVADPCGLLTSPIRIGFDGPAAEVGQAQGSVCVFTWPGEPYRVEVELFDGEDVLGAEYARATEDRLVWIPDMRVWGFPAIGYAEADVLCRLTVGVGERQGVQFRQSPMQPVDSDDRCELNRKVQEEVMQALVRSRR
ncbi:DUF3558 family protein [Actinokineospora sp. NPDC004072]